MHQYVPYVVLTAVLLLSMLITHNHVVNLTTYRNLLDELKSQTDDLASLKRIAESDLNLYVLGGDLKW